MEKISIDNPYGRDLDADAAYLRNLATQVDTPIWLTWVLTTGERVVLEHPLDRIELAAVAGLLERAKYNSGEITVQLYQGVSRRDVPLAEVAWIHLEVGE
jgi:hypothetical protein